MNWQIESEPGSPEHNMAVDTALLASLTEDSGGRPTVRVYQWNRAAVSIGRLQREEPVRQLYPGLPIVRRPTGGRAVLHGQDLTISVALRLESLPPDSRFVLSSYRLIMDNVAAALTASGLTVCYGSQRGHDQANIINCFELSAGCDLVDSVTGTKLVGSAQRRTGDALLQQMSLSGSVISDHGAFLTYLQSEFQQTFGAY